MFDGRLSTPAERHVPSSAARVSGRSTSSPCFYAAELHWSAIAAAVGLAGAMAAMSRAGVRRLWPFLVGFSLLWLAMLASGIHATIAGVVAAPTISLGRGEAHSPLKRLEQAIHPW